MNERKTTDYFEYGEWMIKIRVREMGYASFHVYHTENRGKGYCLWCRQRWFPNRKLAIKYAKGYVEGTHPLEDVIRASTVIAIGGRIDRMKNVK